MHATGVFPMAVTLQSDAYSNAFVATMDGVSVLKVTKPMHATDVLPLAVTLHRDACNKTLVARMKEDDDDEVIPMLLDDPLLVVATMSEEVLRMVTLMASTASMDAASQGPLHCASTCESRMVMEEASTRCGALRDAADWVASSVEETTLRCTCERTRAAACTLTHSVQPTNELSYTLSDESDPPPSEAT